MSTINFNINNNKNYKIYVKNNNTSFTRLYTDTEFDLNGCEILITTNDHVNNLFEVIDCHYKILPFEELLLNVTTTCQTIKFLLKNVVVFLPGDYTN